MKLSISARIAEGFLSKEEARLTLTELADVAVSAGYEAICMRASQVGVHSSREQLQMAASILKTRGLGVTMVTGDFNIVYNNDDGPACLTNIRPYLDLAESLSAPLIRVCLRTPENIAQARLAADLAAQRGLTLVHQCHVQSLFETVDQIEATLRAIDHPAFGLIFEAANLEECGQSYGAEIIQRLAPWIRNVYLQNQRIKDDGQITMQTWCRGNVSFDVIPMDEPGGIDFAAVFQGLQRIGYFGPITVHQSGPEGRRSSDSIDPADDVSRTVPSTSVPAADCAAAAERSAQFLRSLLTGPGSLPTP